MNPTYAWVAIALLSFSRLGHGGLLDDLNKAADIVKKASAVVNQAVPPTTTTNPSTLTSENRVLALPLNFTEYPRSSEYKRIDNPLELVQIPISVPQQTPDGYLSRYTVPMEGRVTMLQYVHRKDDSPLLIQRHYESWLIQAGFERLMVCESPCPALPQNHRWKRMVDPTQRLNESYLPGNPTYIAALRGDAMVLIGIGEHNFDFTSVVKIVVGRALDTQAWKLLTAPRSTPVSVAPTPPALRMEPAPPTTTQTPPSVVPVWPATPSATVKAQESTLPQANVESVDPKKILSVIAKSKGLVIVHLTSGDSNCGYCVMSNTVFADFARIRPTQARYVEVRWTPWDKGFKNDILFSFLRNYRVEGLPSYLVLRDGVLLQRTNGNVTQSVMERMLTAKPTGPTAAEELTVAQLQSLLSEVRKIKHAKKPKTLKDLQPNESLLVQFTSKDPACQPCLRANAEFDRLAAAAAHGGLTRLVRVSWDPWQSAINDSFIKENKIQGFPTHQNFTMGYRRGFVMDDLGDGTALRINSMGTGLVDFVINFIGGPETYVEFNPKPKPVQ